jgi:diguanylate cyclase (GGDEF)-like protein
MTDAASGSRPWARQLALHGTIAGLWLLAYAVARIQEHAPFASLWFPPAGLSVAAFLALGWRGLPGVMAASVAVTLLGALRPDARPLAVLLGAGFGFALAHCAPYFLAARLLVRRGTNRPTPGTVSAFLLIAPASALCAAAGGLLVALAFGLSPSMEAAATSLLPWWIGDFVGVIALGPFFAVLLGWLLPRFGFETPSLLRLHREALPAAHGLATFLARFGLCLVPVALSAGFVAASPEKAQLGSFVVFFSLVPLTWIAHTLGAVRTYLASAALSVAIAGTGALLGAGPHAVTYQFAMIILAGSAYFGLAVPLLYTDNLDLRRLLTTDSLTGAATRSFFLETAERELGRARRFETPLSLVSFDLDRFKSLNDTFGHAFGDEVLAAVGARARATLRLYDTLGRMGGEEFVILLPMTKVDAASEAAERLAEALRCAPVTRGSATAIVTASFGVVEVDVAVEGLAAALERADQVLYDAKRGGRDRVCIEAPLLAGAGGRADRG